MARLWSSRIIAVNRSAGTSGACDFAIRQLVLAGLPTTRILTSSAAFSLIASPCGLKIPPFASSRSARSIPLERGRAPTSSAMLVPSNASFGSSEMSMARRSGKAQSSSSIAVPSAAWIASGISSRRSFTSVSGPSICAGGDPKEDRVADLACGAGDCDVDGGSLTFCVSLASEVWFLGANSSHGAPYRPSMPKMRPARPAPLPLSRSSQRASTAWSRSVNSIHSGLSDRQLRRRVASGWLHRLHRGVYAVGHPNARQRRLVARCRVRLR